MKNPFGFQAPFMVNLNGSTVLNRSFNQSGYFNHQHGYPLPINQNLISSKVVERANMVPFQPQQPQFQPQIFYRPAETISTQPLPVRQNVLAYSRLDQRPASNTKYGVPFKNQPQIPQRQFHQSKEKDEVLSQGPKSSANGQEFRFFPQGPSVRPGSIQNRLVSSNLRRSNISETSDGKRSNSVYSEKPLSTPPIKLQFNSSRSNSQEKFHIPSSLRQRSQSELAKFR